MAFIKLTSTNAGREFQAKREEIVALKDTGPKGSDHKTTVFLSSGYSEEVTESIDAIFALIRV